MHSLSSLATLCVLLTELQSVVSAQGVEYTQISGTGAGQFEGQQIFDNAARNPVLSASLPIAGFDLTTDQNTLGSAGTWYWNLNLTDVRVENSTLGEDALVTSVVYDLGLDVPGLPLSADSGWQFCASVWQGNFDPSFQPFSDNVQGNCGLVLGEECLSAWSSAASDTNIDDAGECVPPPAFSEIPECGNLSSIETQWSAFCKYFIAKRWLYKD
jgi:hypothetical protein